MGEKSCIMVIDDDRTSLRMTEETLTESYDVSLALSGDQALIMLRNCEAPDLILLDIDMPDMDGYETFKHISDIETLTNIPIIFLTGMTGNEPELAGLKLGAQDYISKPYAKENLLARIRLRLESGKQTRHLQILRERLQETQTDEERFSALTMELTPVEQKVARLIYVGCDNQEISRQLSYSIGYVKNLVTIIYSKLNVNNRRELRELFRGQ